jgi:hypothetical protein
MAIAVGVAAATVAAGTPSYAADPAAVMEGLKGVSVTGYVEASYNYNLNDPADQLNRFRLFDSTADTFEVDMAELVLTKLPKTGAGFGLVLNYGLDTQFTSAVGTTTADEFDLQQAYVGYGFASGSAWWRLGKFATMHGAEVIEGPANYNISRSLLFNWAIPFTHTGLRLHYEVSPALTGHIGVNNGWDNIRDDGKGKSFEAQVGLAAGPLSLSVQGMYGPEDVDGAGPSADFDNRGLVDVVATLTPADNVTVVFNYDRGSQADGMGPGDAALWQGYAAYVKLGVGEKHSIALRGEVFDDQDGFRTTAGLLPQTLKEVTLTFACKMMDSLEWRAEYRYDMSNQDVFVDSDNVAKDTQSTVALAAYYSF